MHIAYQLGCVLGSVAALATLSACTGVSPGTSPTLYSGASGSSPIQSIIRQDRGYTAGVQGIRNPNRNGVPVKESFSQEVLARGGAMSFVSDAHNSVVYVVDSKGVIAATLTGFSKPDGLTIDRTGNLYVANSGAGNVLELAPPYNGTPKVINDPGERPTGVAVDGNGNVAVAAGIDSNGGSGNIAFYAAGATSPTTSITDKDLTNPYNCAFDGTGNLYITGTGTNFRNIVGEIVGGISGSTITLLSTGNSIQSVGGIKVARKTGFVSIVDEKARAIFSYKPPMRGSLGKPVATTPLSGPGNPVNFAFVPGNNFVLVANPNADAVQRYQFPTGGAPVKTIAFPSGAVIEGVAINSQGQS